MRLALLFSCVSSVGNYQHIFEAEDDLQSIVRVGFSSDPEAVSLKCKEKVEGTKWQSY